MMKITMFEKPQIMKYGNLPICRVQMVPQTVIYFTAYDQLKVRFGHVEGETSLMAPLTAGVTARCKFYCVSTIRAIVIDVATGELIV